MSIEDLVGLARDGRTKPANAVLVTDPAGEEAALLPGAESTVLKIVDGAPVFAGEGLPSGIVPVTVNGFTGIGVKDSEGQVRAAITFDASGETPTPSVVLSVLNAAGTVVADYWLADNGVSRRAATGTGAGVFMDQNLSLPGGSTALAGTLTLDGGIVGTQAGYVDPASETFAADLVTALQAVGLMSPPPG